MNVSNQIERTRRESVMSSFSSLGSMQYDTLEFGCNKDSNATCTTTNNYNNSNVNFSGATATTVPSFVVTSCSSSSEPIIEDNKNTTVLLKQFRRKSKNLKDLVANFWMQSGSSSSSSSSYTNINSNSSSSKRRDEETPFGNFHPIDFPTASSSSSGTTSGTRSSNTNNDTNTKHHNTNWVHTGDQRTSTSGPLFPTKGLFAIGKDLFNSNNKISNNNTITVLSPRAQFIGLSDNNIISASSISSSFSDAAATVSLNSSEHSNIEPINTTNNNNNNNSYNFNTTMNTSHATTRYSTCSNNQCTQSDGVEVPGQYDIVCGRNSGAYNYIGNRRFRVTVEMNLQRYIDSSTREEKTNVIKSIVCMLHEDIGARFLKKKLVKVSDPINGGTRRKVARYTIMTEKQAREKVGHALRDLVITARKEQYHLQQQQGEQNQDE